MSNFCRNCIVFALFVATGCGTTKQTVSKRKSMAEIHEMNSAVSDSMLQKYEDVCVNEHLLSFELLPYWYLDVLPDTAFKHTMQGVETNTYTYNTNAHVGRMITGNHYNNDDGVLMFRGNMERDMPVVGSVIGTPSSIEVDWVFNTDYNNNKTEYGVWGGGLGWTGQPILVNWTTSQLNSFRYLSEDFKESKSNIEIMIGSLSGTIFFIDFDSGNSIRPSIETNNPIKGTMSLDPRLNGMLYVGQGVPHNDDFGIQMIDLYQHKVVYSYSGLTDPVAFRRWGAFDSSPVLVGDFLYWPGENGVLYKFLADGKDISLVAKMNYRVSGKTRLGIESSMAVYKNYGYFADNSGSVFCVNLLTMKPVWHFDNVDDVDATIVLEVEDGIPYIYTGCEVDQQPDEGFSYFTKINGLNGTKVWTNKIRCYAVTVNNKRVDGGMFSTPLLGRNNADDLIISVFSQTENNQRAELIAIYKSTGEIAYRTRLNAYSWSSPVALYNEKGDLFIFVGDVVGNAYIINGQNGDVIIRKNIGNNFEASPVVWGNKIIIGSRGREIYKLSID